MHTKERCSVCGEDLSENELEFPMDEFGVCDDCTDDLADQGLDE